ncbi:hypothetical protein DSECCO2_349900 [anaerobic digester metagenome]
MISWGAPASWFSLNRWLIRMMSTSLWVRSSSERWPFSRMIEGRIVTGGTGSTVRIVHSGRATSGLIPRRRRSESGIRSSRARMSAGVSLCSFFLPSSSRTSEKVVGFSKFTFSCCSPQWGQDRSFLMSFSVRKSPPSSSSAVIETFWISSGERRSRPHARQVTRRSFRIRRVYPTWMTGLASSMWPKWPGQSAAFWSQVLQRSPGSITPSARSISPWG